MKLRRNHLLFLLVLACLVGAVRFAMRGPMKSEKAHDFGTVFASSRAWLSGQNPYDESVIARNWMQAGGSAEETPTKDRTPSVYPISTFLCLSPLAALPWSSAWLWWCAINVLAMIVLVDCVRRLAGFALWSARFLFLLAGTLVLRPFSSAVALGQSSLIVTMLGAFALLTLPGGSSWMRGVLNGLGLAIKGPLAAVFVLPDLMTRRWKALVIAAVVLLLLMVAAMLRAGPVSTWGRDWMDNLRSASGSGGVNDPSMANPNRHQLLNLQYPLATTITNPPVVNGIVWTAGLLMVFPGLLRLRHPLGRSALLLPMALVSVVEVMAFYHRLYDATVLIFPLAWALLPRTPRWQSWPVFLLLLPFVTPGSEPMNPASQDHIWTWERLFVARESIMLFLLGLWLSVCQWTEEKENTPA